MTRKYHNLFFLLLFIFVTFLLFWQSFIKSNTLFPGNFLIAWFEPYKSETFSQGNILIAHKPVADDVFRHIYPFKTLAVDEIRQWQLPLWNPYNGSGMPLLATINSGLIDPFNLLFFIMPSALAWNMYLLLQFVVIGFFTYLYCRRINLSLFASFFAAITFMLSGAVVARVSLGAYGIGIAMLPLLLFVIESFLANRKTKLLFLLPFAIFTCMTSTHPQITFYILGFSFLYFFIRANVLKKNLNTFLKMFFFFVLGILLSAVQIIPTAELLLYSNFRTETSSHVSNFLVPFYHLIAVAIPNYFGNAATYNFWGKSDYIETVAAIGLIPCFFVYVALFLKGKIKTPIAVKKLFLWATGISIVLAVASPISEFILSLPIPILSTDPPSRIFILTSFFLSILGGIGFEAFREQKDGIVKKLKGAALFLTLVILLIIGTGFLYQTTPVCDNTFIKNCYQIAMRNTLLEVGIFTGGFLLFLFSQKNKKLTTISPLIIIGFVLIIGLYNAQKYLPFSPAATVFPTSNLLHKLTTLSGNERVFGFGDATITSNFATQFKFYDPQYYHPLYIKRYGELTTYANHGTTDKVLRSDAIIVNGTTLSETDEFRRQRLLSLLNIRYFIFNNNQRELNPGDKKVIWSDDKRHLIQNSDALPRSFAVNDIVIEKNDQKILQTLFSKQFSPEKQLIVEEDLAFTPEKRRLESSILISSYRENKVELNTTTNTKSILVLMDNYYPGWNAYIDGKPTKVYRADYTFRAVVLPEGKHVVQFVYEPWSAKIGLFLSLGALFMILLFLLGAIKPQSRQENKTSV
jgi:hypothetical protein